MSHQRKVMIWELFDLTLGNAAVILVLCYVKPGPIPFTVNPRHSQKFTHTTPAELSNEPQISISSTHRQKRKWLQRRPTHSPCNTFQETSRLRVMQAPEMNEQEYESNNDYLSTCKHDWTVGGRGEAALWGNEPEKKHREWLLSCWMFAGWVKFTGSLSRLVQMTFLTFAT